MRDIGHEADCSCGLCQPQAAKIRQLERDLAAANAKIAELEADLTRAIENMDGPACLVLTENRDMKARIAELEQELAALKEAGRWHLIDSVPHDTPVMVVANGVTQYIIVRLPLTGDWINCGDDEELPEFYPTHWRSLPQPPKEGE